MFMVYFSIAFILLDIVLASSQVCRNHLWLLLRNLKEQQVRTQFRNQKTRPTSSTSMSITMASLWARLH